MGQPPDSDYIRVGRIAVQRGLLSREELEAAIRELGKLTYGNNADAPTLGEHLVRGGRISRAELEEIEEQIRREILSPPPQRFGRYELVRELGRGGMSVVWEAHDADLKRRVAIKFLTGYSSVPGKEGLEDDEVLQRFYREAQTAAKLTHPNIIRIFEVNVHEGKHYIVMEYVDGHTLGEAVSKRRLSLRAIVQLLHDAARGIDHAHRNGVLHRDVKPQNIMVDTGGRVVVMDFGLARFIKEDRRLTLSGVAIGTPSYMPPEHAQGSKNETDPRSDVYSLGAVLYEVLTGRPPFIGESPVEVMLSVVQDDAVSPRRLRADCPLELEAICLKAIEKERERRYQTAGHFADDLRRFLDGDPVLARAPSMVYRARKKLLKHRGVVAALALAALLGVGWLLFMMYSAMERRDRIEQHLRQAELYYVRGDYVLARVEYDGALQLDARHPVASEGRRYTELKILEEAKARERQEADRKAAERAEADRKERAERARAHVRAGRDKHARRDYRGALEEYDRAIGLDPAYADAYHQRGHAHEGLRDPARAYEDLSKALELSPDAELCVEVGRMLAQQGKYDAAIELYRRALDLKADSAQAYHHMGHALEGLRRPDEAEVSLQKAVALDPDSAELWKELGDHAVRRHEDKEAEGLYAKAVEKLPAYGEAHHQLGHLHLRAKDYEAAIQDFTEAIRHGKLAKFYADRAEASFGKWQSGGRKDAKLLDDIVGDCTACLRTDEKQAGAYLYRARAYRFKGVFDRAEKDYRKLLEISPKHEKVVTQELEAMEKERAGGS